MSTQPFARNPADVEVAYLRELNRAFPGWGGRDSFAWWFKRQVGAPPADLLVIGKPEAPVAGMAVTYRLLVDATGRDRLAGVLTGAWTIEQQRRRGHFRELIRRAKQTAADRGAAGLLGFARSTRQSIGELERASVGTLPAWWLSVPGDSARTAETVAAAPTATELRRWFHDHRRGGGMLYPTPVIFAEHARLGEPGTQVTRAGNGMWGIVRSDRDRLGIEALVPEHGPVAPEAFVAGLARAAAGSRGADAYTSDPAVAAASAERGWHVRSAIVFVLTPDDRPIDAWTNTRWAFQAIDKA